MRAVFPLLSLLTYTHRRMAAAAEAKMRGRLSSLQSAALLLHSAASRQDSVRGSVRRARFSCRHPFASDTLLSFRPRFAITSSSTIIIWRKKDIAKHRHRFFINIIIVVVVFVVIVIIVGLSAAFGCVRHVILSFW